MASKKLFLLDGNALIYRAHFAFISRPLINSKGLNTSAITGFVRTLWDLMKNQEPSHLAVSFDISSQTFRHEWYPEYKANREEMPEDIRTAIPYIKDIVRAFRIPIVELENYEADDLIGTLAQQAEKEGFEVYMVTPDKDYGQLVTEHVKMYKPSRQGNGVEILGIEEICEQWNIKRTDQVIDILGLQGDSVDNIPGIPGIGPKTAAKLLGEYDTLENLIEHAEELKGKQKERVIEFADQALLSKKLATINTEAPIQFDANTYVIEPYDRTKLSALFKELEFRSLAQSILGEGQAGTQSSLFGQTEAASSTPVKRQGLAAHAIAEKTANDVPHEYHLVDTEDDIRKLIDQLRSNGSFCFDTETTGLDAHQAQIIGLSVAIKPHEAYYIPVPKDQKQADARMALFKELFEDPAVTKIGQNVKYDAIILKWCGIELKGYVFDTMLVHYLLSPELRHGMDYLAETYLKYKPISITSLIGKKGKNQLSMRDVPLEKVVEYAAEDADITLQLKEHFEPEINSSKLKEIYDKIEEPLMKVLVDLEYAGIRLDKEYLDDYSKELTERILSVESQIYDKAEVRFNIASPKQVGEVLFDKMEIPYRWRKTKSGTYSTSEEKLAELAKDHDIVDDILKYRGLTKLKSTYVDALPKMINPKTGRIHSSFNQALAATGRLSSNNPNLQNIPIRTPEGRKVREAFVPRSEEYILLAADYSQIELRLIAEISGDEAMLEAFSAGQDIHRATAARVYGVPYDEVTADQRRNAKTVNFSIIYGAGATNLSQQLDIKRAEAGELIKQYFSQYQGLKKYMDDTVEYARENGCVETLLGRRRNLRDINSKNGMLRSAAERIAINTPIQGTAADMIKLAMIDIHQYLKDHNCQTKMILQVHDELVFDLHRDEEDALMPVIEEKMRTAIPDLKVPILVGMGLGENWLEAH